MCFSAEASFGAGTVLTVTGLILAKKFKGTKILFLALIPFFFGIQQISEGVLWVALKKGEGHRVYSSMAQDIFLFFAYMFWPVWIPLAFGLAEKVQGRQFTMGVLMLLGSLFFFGFGDHFMSYTAVNAKLIKHSIDYGISNPWTYKILYGIITMTPFLISSIRKMWILGIGNTIAFAIATLSYDYAFTSVWCGVCALISGGLCLLLKKDHEAYPLTNGTDKQFDV